MEGDDAFVLLEGVVDFAFVVGGVDGVGGDDEDEVVGAADAVEEFGFEVDAGADVFLVEPGGFAGGLEGVVEAAGEVAVFAGVGDEGFGAELAAGGFAGGDEGAVVVGGGVGVAVLVEVEPGFGVLEVVAAEEEGGLLAGSVPLEGVNEEGFVLLVVGLVWLKVGEDGFEVAVFKVEVL